MQVDIQVHLRRNASQDVPVYHWRLVMVGPIDTKGARVSNVHTEWDDCYKANAKGRGLGDLWSEIPAVAQSSLKRLAKVPGASAADVADGWLKTLNEKPMVAVLWTIVAEDDDGDDEQPNEDEVSAAPTHTHTAPLARDLRSPLIKILRCFFR